MEFACKNETSSSPARRRRRGNPAFWSRRCYLAPGGTAEPLGDSSPVAPPFSPFPRQGELYKTRERLILSRAAGNGRCSPLFPLVIFDLLLAALRAPPPRSVESMRRLGERERELDKQSRPPRRTRDGAETETVNINILERTKRIIHTRDGRRGRRHAVLGE